MRYAHTKDGIDRIGVEPHINGPKPLDNAVTIIDRAHCNALVVKDPVQLVELIGLLQDAAEILEWEMPARGTTPINPAPSIGGIPIMDDPSMPEDEVQFRHPDGRVDKFKISE